MWLSIAKCKISERILPASALLMASSEINPSGFFGIQHMEIGQLVDDLPRFTTIYIFLKKVIFHSYVKNRYRVDQVLSNVFVDGLTKQPQHMNHGTWERSGSRENHEKWYGEFPGDIPKWSHMDDLFHGKSNLYMDDTVKWGTPIVDGRNPAPPTGCLKP